MRSLLQPPAAVHAIWATFALCAACGASALTTDAGPCDRDGDGHAALACGGDDCNDASSAVGPEVEEDEAWRLETVGEGNEADLALGPGETAHLVIAVPSSSAPALVWAVREGDGWTTETVEAGPISNARVAVESSGTVHILYSAGSTSGDFALHHARRRRDEWIVQIRATGRVGVGAVAVDAEDRLHASVAVQTSPGITEARHAVLDPYGWRETLVWTDDGGCFGHRTSLLVDESGRSHELHVQACDADDCLTGWRALHSHEEAEGWSTELLPKVGVSQASLARRADGSLVAALVDWGDPYCFGKETSLRLDRLSASGWDLEVVAHGVRTAELALGADGRTHMAFLDDNAQVVSYQRDVDGPWPPEVIETAALSESMQALSLEVGPTYVHVAYAIIDNSASSPIRSIHYARRSIPNGVDDDCDKVAW